MQDDSGTNLKPPYLPFATFRNFLDGLKASGVPSRIDSSVLVGYSGSISSWLKATLKFFALTDDAGHPTADLERLAVAEGDERKKIFKQLFDKSYGPIVKGLHLEKATLGQLNEQFQKLGLSGETLTKCDAFFAAFAEEAGIALAAHFKSKGRASGPRKPRKVRTPKAEKGHGGNDADSH